MRLPKECRFPPDQREVLVHREGEKIVLEPVDQWPRRFLACLGAWHEEIERPEQEPIASLKDPFA